MEGEKKGREPFKSDKNECKALFSTVSRNLLFFVLFFFSFVWPFAALRYVFLILDGRFEMADWFPNHNRKSEICNPQDLMVVLPAVSPPLPIPNRAVKPAMANGTASM